MGVSKNSGKTPKMMVYLMENPIEIDDLEVKKKLFLGSTQHHPYVNNSQGSTEVVEKSPEKLSGFPELQSC